MSCPVDHKSQSACPVDQNQELNPNNMMPDIKNAPHPDQSITLDTKKTNSSILKSDGKSVWEYPSPQQFYNALKRKGWDTREDDVETMVNIHNFLNEECWKQVIDWENKYHCECSNDRTLVKFRGRPTELSPKARLFTLFGVEKPFDRHDWTIDRCGKSVRYVIDYYGGDEVEVDGSPVFYCDVRPALDSPGAFVDRAKSTFEGLRKWMFG